METEDQKRIRLLETEVAKVTVLVNGMSADVKTIKNSIVTALLIMISTMFGGLVYFAQQKDDIVQRIDRNFIEYQRREDTATTDRRVYANEAAEAAKTTDPKHK